MYMHNTWYIYICIIHVQRILVESACFPGQGHSTNNWQPSVVMTPARSCRCWKKPELSFKPPCVLPTFITKIKHLVTSLLFVYFIRFIRWTQSICWDFFPEQCHLWPGISLFLFLTGSEIPMFANISTSVACPNPHSCCKTLQFCAAVRLKPQFLAVKSPCLATYISILLGYRYKL